MTNANRRWLKAAAATVGAGALTLGGVVLPATAEELPEAVVSLNAEANKYELAAAKSNSTVAELQAQEAMGYVSVKDGGYVLAIDPARSGGPTPVSTHNLTREASGAEIPGSPASGSRPGAPLTIYLNFGGETLTDTIWNYAEGEESLTLAPASAANAAFQADVWAAVAEDFAPFNVNVTTTRPSDDDLFKTSASDERYGVHVIITDSYDEVITDAINTSGLAYHDGVGSSFLQGALVFTEGVSGGDPAYLTTKSVADTASHEAGHNFNLEHRGHTDTGAYYYPRAGVWGPIMGATYDVPVSHWTDGSYAGHIGAAEGDLETITDRSRADYEVYDVTLPDGTSYPGLVCGYNGSNPANPQPGDQWQVPNSENLCDGTGAILDLHFHFWDFADYAADEVGNTPAAATALDNADGTFEFASVIETNTDVDVFSIETAGGEITVDVSVADIGPNLDAKLTLTDESGAEIAVADPAASAVSHDEVTGFSASITTTVEEGTYYAAVEGTGFGTPNTATGENSNGYTDYGSLGNYTISGTAAPIEDDVVGTITIDSPADGTEVEGDSEVTVTGTAEPNAEVTVSVDGTEVGTVTADDEGNWTTTITANPYGDTVVTATQSVDGEDLPGTATVTVTAPVTEITIDTPTNGTEVTGGEEVPVTGTAHPDAEVTISVDGTVIGTITADDEGNWSTVVTANETGDTVITATQSIEGYDVPGVATVTITAQEDEVPTVPAPVVLTPADNSTIDTLTPTFTGTGTPGGFVTVVITDAAGNEIVGEVTVGADGTWELTFAADFAEGDFTVFATQLVDDVMSPASNTNAFTIALPTDTGDDEDDLAETGSEANAGLFALLALALVLAGGGTAAMGIRQRKQAAAKN